MLHRVDLVTTDVSKDRRASIIRVTRISELGTTLAVTSNRRTLRRNVLTRATQRKILEDGILHSHRHGNLKYYIELTVWCL
jgi:mRNA-degrading endonuclease toxin of MazEF toxin-antitoxin module